MAKRHRRDSPEDYGSDLSESPEGYEEGRRKKHKEMSNIDQMVRSVIRHLLARDLRGTLIRREHISQVITNKELSTQNIVEEVDRVLKSIYGLTLKEVPGVERDGKRQSSSQKSSKQYILLSNLSKEARIALAKTSERKLESTIPNGRLEQDSLYFMPRYQSTSLPMSNQELVKKGILVAVLSQVVVSENRMSEDELLSFLVKFGISKNINERNSNINANYAEIFQDFTRQEYLHREVIKGATRSEDSIYYSLGRRAYAEFPAESVFECIKSMYIATTSQEDFEGSKGRLISTIRNVYGEDSLAQPSEQPRLEVESRTE